MIQTPSPALLTAVLVVLSIGDILSTRLAIKAGGNEVMPGRSLLGRFGITAGGIITKALGVPLIIFLMFHWPDPTVLWGTAIALFALLAVVGWNLFAAAAG